ncbi:MAG: hypothetical protein ACXQS2_06425 [Methermicoccaceae archaeon]
MNGEHAGTLIKVSGDGTCIALGRREVLLEVGSLVSIDPNPHTEQIGWIAIVVDVSHAVREELLPYMTHAKREVYVPYEKDYDAIHYTLIILEGTGGSVRGDIVGADVIKLSDDESRDFIKRHGATWFGELIERLDKQSILTILNKLERLLPDMSQKITVMRSYVRESL